MPHAEIADPVGPDAPVDGAHGPGASAPELGRADMPGGSQPAGVSFAQPQRLAGTEAPLDPALSP
jgi:hypothetical protein